MNETLTPRWSNPSRKHFGVCETQPSTIEGLRSLTADGDLECRWAVSSLPIGLQMLRQAQVDVVLLDKGFGMEELLTAIAGLDETRRCRCVVWGTSMTETDALRILQAGARGILRKTADGPTILNCLREVASGGTWMEECVFRDHIRAERLNRNNLTHREQQVLELVEQGLRNKDIAEALGIRPGTVKIHLKHIFEKTGVHGRYGIALNNLRQKGILTVAYPAGQAAKIAC